MRLIHKILVITAVMLLPLTSVGKLVAQADSTKPDCTQPALACAVTKSTSTFSSFLTTYPTPAVTAPVNTNFSTPAPKISKPVTATVKYQTATNGTITADYETFKTQVQETYDNPNGWSRLGVRFERVDSGGQFTVVLSEASLVPAYASICDSTYSCTAGNYVVINQDRWLGATDPWNQAGGDLRNYRHMVVNHETGHWLGHGHQQCGGAGQAAPVMQQQSINLQGCKFNPWPLDGEIWSTRLGI